MFKFQMHKVFWIELIIRNHHIYIATIDRLKNSSPPSICLKKKHKDAPFKCSSIIKNIVVLYIRNALIPNIDV